MAGISGARTFCGVYTAAQTNLDVIGVPPLGRRIVLHWVHIANGITAAGDFKLLDGPVISVSGVTQATGTTTSLITAGVYVPTGATVVVTASTATPATNGTFVATNVNATTFTIPITIPITIAGTCTVNATGTTVFGALLAAYTPATFDGSRAPIVLTAATPLCFTSATATTQRVNIGYSVEF